MAIFEDVCRYRLHLAASGVGLANSTGAAPPGGHDHVEQRGGGVMRAASMIRTFLVFFVGGLLLTTAAISAFTIGDMVLLHCLHDDPGQTCGDALFFSVVLPIYGAVIAMAMYFLPLLVGAVLAVVGRAVYGHVPRWSVLAILPACLLAYVVQGSPWYPDQDARSLSDRLLIFAALQTPCLLICWWWNRRAYDQSWP